MDPPNALKHLIFAPYSRNHSKLKKHWYSPGYRLYIQPYPHTHTTHTQRHTHTHTYTHTHIHRHTGTQNRTQKHRDTYTQHTYTSQYTLHSALTTSLIITMVTIRLRQTCCIRLVAVVILHQCVLCLYSGLHDEIKLKRVKYQDLHSRF